MSFAAESSRVYHGAYGLCRSPSGHLLLARLAQGIDEGRWTLPGGGIDWGEHPEATVRRELQEETGITDIRTVRVRAIFSHTYLPDDDGPHDSVHHIGIIYDLTLGHVELRDEHHGTTDQCRWFTEHQAQRLSLVPLGRFAVGLVWPQASPYDHANPAAHRVDGSR